MILFIGDGMGVSTVTAARIYGGQLKGRHGEESVLEFEKFPNVGLSKVGQVLETSVLKKSYQNTEKIIYSPPPLIFYKLRLLHQVK